MKAENDMKSKLWYPQTEFYWNTATLILLNLVHSCFSAMMASWKNCDREPTDPLEKRCFQGGSEYFVYFLSFVSRWQKRPFASAWGGGYCPIEDIYISN